ncbi:hypothetical protein ACMD2_13218 [Ananas comosus]|uniref:RIN4 pathogenic type III effector avirulence factor Avr cleavage site domain-containing protein n=1 Tax=Ananas comosus TaxID=4615 RepID=A0A199UNX4_ANACO|nr:hypothetical protein ACMD2_13218 [Ananas comosus]
MENRKEKNVWMSVPQFGGWDQKAGTPDYSMVFSRARANRKQQKTDMRRASLGNEAELMTYQRYEDGSVRKRKKFLRYLNCCMVA